MLLMMLEMRLSLGLRLMIVSLEELVFLQMSVILSLGMSVGLSAGGEFVPGVDGELVVEEGLFGGV